MENTVKVYLDFQIFDYCSKNPELRARLTNIPNHKFYCSTAHLEEVFRSEKNADTPEKREKAENRKRCIDEVCCRGVLNPTYNGTSPIELRPESRENCLKRIRKYDTSESVFETAEKLKNSHKRSPSFSKEYNNAIKDTRSIKSMQSNIWEIIWKENDILQEIDIKNQNTTNLSYLLEIANPLYKKLKKSYGEEEAKYHFLKCIISLRQKVYRGCYDEILKSNNSYDRLENVVEFLARTLDNCGYQRDSNVQKIYSGEHDISHMIYGSYCDLFVTNDVRLFYRVKAIYYYMGIPTKVISWLDWQKHMNETTNL